MSKPDYSKLDDLIVDQINAVPGGRFAQLESADAIKTEALALELSTERSWGRIIDGRLQALRRAGAIHSKTGGYWHPGPDPDGGQS